MRVLFGCVRLPAVDRLVVNFRDSIHGGYGTYISILSDKTQLLLLMVGYRTCMSRKNQPR